MRKNIIFSCLFLFGILTITVGQSINLKFTGKTAQGDYVQLDRVEITNLTKNWTEVIYYPDTILSLGSDVGIEEYEMMDGFQLSQNTPNPFEGTTEFVVQIPENDVVVIEVLDSYGRKIMGTNQTLPKGSHAFRVHLATAQTYLLKVSTDKKLGTVKMINSGGKGENSIQYIGQREMYLSYNVNSEKGHSNQPFSFGDLMQYVGVALISGMDCSSDTIVQAQSTSQIFTLIFRQSPFGQPCPNIPTVVDIDGNIYNTVQIGAQCWMKENLRTTHYSDGTYIELGQSNSDTIPYRLFPNNDTNNVADYGYLYNWIAATRGQYISNTDWVQGACPNGWHVPTLNDWKQLRGFVRDQVVFRCEDDPYKIGKSLASNFGWVETGSSYGGCMVGYQQADNNATGFSALPAGGFAEQYVHFAVQSIFWSSDGECSSIASSLPEFGIGQSSIGYYYTIPMMSLRCIRDNVGDDALSLPTVITVPISNIDFNNATTGGEVLNEGSSSVITRGVCWSTSENPDVTDSHNSSGSGMGSYSMTLIGLNHNTTYYVRAYATCAYGTVYGDQISFTTPFHCGYSLPGGTIGSVQIGSQCWTKQNLNTSQYADGTSMMQGDDISSESPFYYLGTGGYILYNWKSVMRNFASSNNNPSGVQGICPDGWHIPSDAEWTQLTDYLRSNSYYFCDNDSTNIAKTLATNTSGWIVSDIPCSIGNIQTSSNSSGFLARPQGYYNGSFGDSGRGANFWSCTEHGNNYAYYRSLYYNNADVISGYSNKYNAYSVRCLLGGDYILPTVATDSVISVSSTAASVRGYITELGGANVVSKGVCWSTSPNPTIDDNLKSSSNSTGWSVGPFLFEISGLTPNTTYYIRAFASNSAGTSYGQEVSFVTTSPEGSPCPNAATVVDYDGNVYNTVKIGQQCWMKENLRTTHYSDGTYINVAPTGQASSTIAYCYYLNNSSTNVATYLYNWKAVMRNASSSNTNPSGVQGICPTGWHVPSDAEWYQLTNYLSSQSIYQCNNVNTNIAKSLASSSGWSSSSNSCAVGNNITANNATGFSAMPAGCINSSNNCFGERARFWSSTETSVWDGQHTSYRPYYREIYFENSAVYRYYGDGSSGHSVRCVCD